MAEPFTPEPVYITCEGRTVEGHVILASKNRVSLMLEFEAILANHIAMMPVLAEDVATGRYRSLVGNVLVILAPRDG